MKFKWNTAAKLAFGGTMVSAMLACLGLRVTADPAVISEPRGKVVNPVRVVGVWLVKNDGRVAVKEGDQLWSGQVLEVAAGSKLQVYRYVENDIKEYSEGRHTIQPVLPATMRGPIPYPRLQPRVDLLPTGVSAGREGRELLGVQVWLRPGSFDTYAGTTPRSLTPAELEMATATIETLGVLNRQKLLLKADVLTLAGKSQEAVSVLKSVPGAADDIRVQLKLADLEVEKGFTAEALERYIRASRLAAPTNPGLQGVALSAAGVQYLAAGRNAEAVTAFNGAVGAYKLRGEEDAARRVEQYLQFVLPTVASEAPISAAPQPLPAPAASGR